MMIEQIINREVLIVSNDFQEDDSYGTVIAVDLTDNKILLRLKASSCNSLVGYSKAIASLRHEIESLSSLISKGSASCNITWVPDDQFNPNKPFDLNWWRGGAATISDLRIL